MDSEQPMECAAIRWYLLWRIRRVIGITEPDQSCGSGQRKVLWNIQLWSSQGFLRLSHGATSCWVHKRFDRSPAELLWVESPSWGELDGKLLHLSYGQGRVEVALMRFATDNYRVEWSVYPSPISHRNHASDFIPRINTYLCGMSARASHNLAGGFYRLRATEAHAHPCTMRALKKEWSYFFRPNIHQVILKVSTWALQRTKTMAHPSLMKNLTVSKTSLSGANTEDWNPRSHPAGKCPSAMNFLEKTVKKLLVSKHHSFVGRF